jgi:hypothetical protein
MVVICVMIPSSPSVEQQQRLVDDLAARNPGIPELQGLRVVGGRNARTSLQLRPGQSAGDRGQSGLPSAGARDIAQLLERLYGVRIIPVDSAGPVPFNGVKLKKSNVVFIHAGASKPMLTVAGHELWHHLRETHPGLAREFIEAVTPLLRDIPKYQRRLERMGVGQVDPSGRVTVSEAQAIDEILGDFMGDSLSEPKFLQGLAAQEPNLFKRFARIAVQWLDKLIAKLRNAASGVRTYGSSEFITELETAQRELKMLLVEAARETQYQARGLGTSNIQQPTSNEDGAEFSKEDSADRETAISSVQNREFTISDSESFDRAKITIKRSGQSNSLYAQVLLDPKSFEIAKSLEKRGSYGDGSVYSSDAAEFGENKELPDFAFDDAVPVDIRISDHPPTESAKSDPDIDIRVGDQRLQRKDGRPDAPDYRFKSWQAATNALVELARKFNGDKIEARNLSAAGLPPWRAGIKIDESGATRNVEKDSTQPPSADKSGSLRTGQDVSDPVKFSKDLGGEFAFEAAESVAEQREADEAGSSG